MTDNIIQPDRDIKRFQVVTNDGRVELDLYYVGMLEEYYVGGYMNGKRLEGFRTPSIFEAYNKYNFYFVDAKAEAAALLIKATGAHV